MFALYKYYLEKYIPFFIFFLTVETLFALHTLDNFYLFHSLFAIFDIISESVLFFLISTSIERITKYKHTNKIIFIIAILIYFSSALYYRYFQTLPNISHVLLIKQVINIKHSVFSLLKFSDIVWILPIFISLIKIKLPEIEISYFKITFLSLLFISAMQILPIFFPFLMSNFDKASFRNMDIEFTIKTRGLLIIHIEKIKQNLSFSIDNYIKQQTESISIVSDNIKHKLQNNLIIIQVESLVSCLIGKSINNTEITPNINRLIFDNNSVYYDMISVMAGGGSSDSEYATINGYEPLKDRAIFSEYAGQIKNPNNLFQLFRNKGYVTIFMHGNVGTFWNMKKNYEYYGVEYIFFKDNFSQKNIDTLNGINGIDDRDFFEQSFHKIKEIKNKHNKKFFAFLITLSSHHPYELRIFNNKFTNIKDKTIKNYINSINYTDAQIGNFIQSVLNEMPNTSIIIYGDHKTLIPSSKELSEFLNDNNTCVYNPLVFYNIGHNQLFSKDIVPDQTNILPTLKKLF